MGRSSDRKFGFSGDERLAHGKSQETKYFMVVDCCGRVFELFFAVELFLRVSCLLSGVGGFAALFAAQVTQDFSGFLAVGLPCGF